MSQAIPALENLAMKSIFLFTNPLVSFSNIILSLNRGMICYFKVIYPSEDDA